eukprot:2638766-Amphidinium_carterae.1
MSDSADVWRPWESASTGMSPCTLRNLPWRKVPIVQMRRLRANAATTLSGAMPCSALWCSSSSSSSAADSVYAERGAAKRMPSCKHRAQISATILVHPCQIHSRDHH